MFEISPTIPSPFRWGRARVGVDKGVLVLIGSPLPFTLLDKASIWLPQVNLPI